MRPKQRAVPGPIEIFPAALLSQRQAWGRVARSLPSHACLLMIDAEKQPQHNRVTRQLVQAFRRRGRPVFVWAVQDLAGRPRLGCARAVR